MNSDPLERYKDFSISEAYEVVRTVLVAKGDKEYRLEVTRSVSNANALFDVRCYRLQKVREDELGENVSAYVLDTQFVGAQSKTAEDALTSALDDL